MDLLSSNQVSAAVDAVLLLLLLGPDRMPFIPVEKPGGLLGPDWAPPIPIEEAGRLLGSDWASLVAKKEPEGLLRPLMPALGAAPDMEAALELV